MAPPGEFSNCGVGTLEPYLYVHVKEKHACRLWWNGEYVNARGDYYFLKKDSKGQTPGGGIRFNIILGFPPGRNNPF
jgi:hypothetical protein